jgi:hypothetical protein
MSGTIPVSSIRHRDKAGVFDGVLYQFLCCLVEENVSRLQANAFRQTKMFLSAREN